MDSDSHPIGGGWRKLFAKALGRLWLRAVLVALCAGPLSAPPAALGAQSPANEDGFHATPLLYWKDGDQRLDLRLETRYRIEWWDARASETDAFHALRTRVSAAYAVADRLTLFAQFQDARLYGLGDNASGAGRVYQAFSRRGDSDSTSGQDLRQLWFEVRPRENLSLRVGRMDIELGAQVPDSESNWKYLKIKRASQRLVGTVGWTHGERSNDGATLSYDTGGHHLFVFGAIPTTGVFDLSGAYRSQSDILYGGVSWTVKRDTWLRNTEIRGFFLGYGDDRPASEGGLPEDIEVYTFGFSAIGIYPLGPGNLDLFVWGAGQGGEYNDRDHWAGAGIAELGYQLPELFAKPWLRAGLNIASGGGPSGDHNTFFNMLPTNHLYYGFADHLAFQNLIDILVQLKLAPHPKVGINLMAHHFRLVDADDGQYFGTGAFTKRRNLGFGANPSLGEHEVATELDIVLDLEIYNGLALQGGYSYIWGAEIWETGFQDEDVEWGFLQLSWKY